MVSIVPGVTVQVAPPNPLGVQVVPVPGPRGLTGPQGIPGVASTVPGPPGAASTVPGPTGPTGATGPASITYDTDGVPYLLI